MGVKFGNKEKSIDIGYGGFYKLQMFKNLLKAQEK